MSTIASHYDIVSKENFQLLRPSENASQNKSSMNTAIKSLSKTLQGTFENIRDLTPMCPMGIRELIVGQVHSRAASAGLNNEQNIRIRTLFFSSFIGIGFALTLAARIIRVVFRIVFSPISLAVAAYQQLNYGPKMEGRGKHNIVKEDLIRIGREVVDLAVTIYAGFVGTINTLAPSAIPTDHLRNMYEERITEEKLRNDAFTQAKKTYKHEKAESRRLWENANAI